MKKSAQASLILSVACLLAAAFSQLYAARSMGMLPVINYPLRPYALPLAIIGAALFILTVLLQKRSVR